MRVGAHISLDGSEAACAECGEGIGPIDGNLKEGLVVAERSVEEAGPYYLDPEEFLDDELIYREFYCPGCGTRLFARAAQPDDDPLSEVELDPETL